MISWLGRPCVRALFASVSVSNGFCRRVHCWRRVPHNKRDLWSSQGEPRLKDDHHKGSYEWLERAAHRPLHNRGSKTNDRMAAVQTMKDGNVPEEATEREKSKSRTP